ncbi:MAG TPA: histidine kinase [Sphingomicrobium sp.]|nr:histidine kinase [Sphingomicrobium sp.]
MGGVVHQPSGRIIALGRLMLAVFYAIAVGIDVTQPARAPVFAYSLLASYLVFAAAVVGVTWRNWWLDAKLTGPSHGIDIVVFTALVFVTAGYTSPFFIFFVFLLLSAAIRWGWRETALTALLLVLLYFSTGFVAATSGVNFELYRFIIRTGHLVTLSLLLIWFGLNQWRSRFYTPAPELLAAPSLDQLPLETSLKAAAKTLRAAAGILVWRPRASAEATVCILREGDVAAVKAPPAIVGEGLARPFLYDIARNRGLTRDEKHNLVRLFPRVVFDLPAAAELGLSEGLAVPIATGTGAGMLFLEGMADLSTDHIDLGQQLADDVVAHIQRHALLKAAAESAESRSRLSLARDLHDSIVQFLAGSAFRLEAMKRSAASGRTVEPELSELKELTLLEQGELRSFIAALRSGSDVPMADLLKDIEALSARLARQWAIDCTFTSRSLDMTVPTSLNLNVHQLVREAVANAVRHAGATKVQIALHAAADSVRLEIVNNGKAFKGLARPVDMPQSLRERAEQAGGTIELSRGMGVTKFAVTLPLEGHQA